MLNMHPYLYVEMITRERERTMARNALERAARSAKYDASPGAADRPPRRNPLLRLAAIASAAGSLGSKALHLTRSTGV